MVSDVHLRYHRIATLIKYQITYIFFQHGDVDTTNDSIYMQSGCTSITGINRPRVISLGIVATASIYVPGHSLITISNASEFDLGESSRSMIYSKQSLGTATVASYAVSGTFSAVFLSIALIASFQIVTCILGPVAGSLLGWAVKSHHFIWTVISDSIR